MFEVYGVHTGQVIGRFKDMVKANQMAISYTETYYYINGETFEYRIVNADNNRGSNSGKEASSIHRGSGKQTRLSIVF